jgi:hypothetical protein
MSEEASALSTIAPPPAAQSDYESICAALMHTERGRWFLEEYARRNRSADTQLLLAAIGRIETVICAERNRQAQQGFRSDLLEMAKAITRTRAEVAEIRSDAAAPADSAPSASEASSALQQPRSGDVFAAAERIRDVTWAMRGHGFDPSTCNQLEQLASSILSASALRDPTDHRASKLSEVLQYLEHRIETLLESSADGDPPVPETVRARDHDGFAAPTGQPGSGFTDTFAAEEHEPGASEAAAETLLPPQGAPHGDRLAAREDFEGGAPAEMPPLTIEISRHEPLAPPPPERSDDPALSSESPAPEAAAAELAQPLEEVAAGAPEQPISEQNYELATEIADIAAAPLQSVTDSAVPESPQPAADQAAPVPTVPCHTAGLAADTGLSPERGPGPSGATTWPDQPLAMQAELPAEEATGDDEIRSSPSIVGNGAATPQRPPHPFQDTIQETLQRAIQETLQGALLPAVELCDSSQLMLKAAAAHAASTAVREATRTLLPEIDMRSDMPGFDDAPQRGAPAAATASPEVIVATPKPAELAPPSFAAAPSLAVAPLPQPPGGDPLAALKAMSDDELIALFS